MRVIRVRVPEVFGDLYKPEQDRLLHRAFRHYARQRAQELQAETIEAKEHIRKFEARYGVTFSEFEERVLPTLSSADAHDDYNAWLFWESVLERQTETLHKLHNLGLTSDEDAA